MALKPEVSLPIALATAAVVYGVYSNFTPSITDVKASPANDSTVDSARKAATWTAAAAVAGISLIAKDPTIFVVGGAMVVVMDWHTRHAVAASPETGKVVGATSVASMAPGVATPSDDTQGDVYPYAG